MVVAEDQWPPTERVIEEALVVDVPEIGSLAAVEIERRGSHEPAHAARNAGGEDLARRLVKTL